jgi:hypothetical protein
MLHELDAIGQSTHPGTTGTVIPGSFGWRHVATALLLLLTVPVFVAASAVALAILPVLLVMAGTAQFRHWIRPAPEPVPVRLGR